jgi:hypothetical protein
MNPALKVSCPECHAPPAHRCRTLLSGEAREPHEARALEYAGLAQALGMAALLREADRAMSDTRYDLALGSGRC